MSEHPIRVGNENLLTQPKSLVLNSRQSKQPTGRSEWIRRSREAVRSLADSNTVLLSSVGMNTWEFCCWAAGENSIPQVVGAPLYKDETPESVFDSLVADFSLNPDITCLFLFPCPKHRPKSFWKERDRFLVELADRILPVSIRSRGGLATLLSDPDVDRKVDHAFRLEGDPLAGRRTSYQFDQDSVQQTLDVEFKDSLFHWTRAANGPWAGESRADYYRAVSESDTEYPRSARRTMERIVSERLVRGSGWRIRNQQPVVALTSLPPSAAVSLMRWRSRYARYTVEPFGIAVDRETAARTGAREVHYLDEAKKPASNPDYLLQRTGSRGAWPEEREFRLLGDLNLSKLPDGSWKPIEIPHSCRES